MNFFRKKGFTLLELMIVVIIIGILASLAIPRFITATRRARFAAATQMLDTIRSAQIRHFAEYNSYYAGSIRPGQEGSALDIDLEFDSNRYTIDGAQATTNSGNRSDFRLGRVTDLTPEPDITYIIDVGGNVSEESPSLIPNLRR